MTKKLTDAQKLQRVVRNVELALYELDRDTSKAVKLNSIIRNLAFAYAVVHVGLDDDLLITGTAAELYRQLTGGKETQLALKNLKREEE